MLNCVNDDSLLRAFAKGTWRDMFWIDTNEWWVAPPVKRPRRTTSFFKAAVGRIKAYVSPLSNCEKFESFLVYDAYIQALNTPHTYTHTHEVKMHLSWLHSGQRYEHEFNWRGCICVAATARINVIRVCARPSVVSVGQQRFTPRSFECIALIHRSSPVDTSRDSNDADYESNSIESTFSYRSTDVIHSSVRPTFELRLIRSSRPHV